MGKFCNWLLEGSYFKLLIIFFPIFVLGYYLIELSKVQPKSKEIQSFIITYNDVKCKVDSIQARVNDFEVKKGYVYFYHNKEMKIKESNIIDICEE